MKVRLNKLYKILDKINDVPLSATIQELENNCTDNHELLDSIQNIRSELKFNNSKKRKKGGKRESIIRNATIKLIKIYISTKELEAVLDRIHINNSQNSYHSLSAIWFRENETKLRKDINAKTQWLSENTVSIKDATNIVNILIKTMRSSLLLETNQSYPQLIKQSLSNDFKELKIERRIIAIHRITNIVIEILDQYQSKSRFNQDDQSTNFGIHKEIKERFSEFDEISQETN